MSQSERPTLSIIIPSLNEEEAIGRTISRCLESAEGIRAASGVEVAEIVVVNDGSTDRTGEIARSFPGVQLVEFAENRGYGAALQEGFRHARGSLLGFLDADGTCDPRLFGEMCRVALAEKADVVIGSRMGPGSEMPRIRKLGNRFFALLLGFLCGRPITDTASGMRVLRRDAIEELYPLPTGLHFTPSMSARALLGGLRVVEVPIPYSERIGRSKLKLLRDGFRFLRVILADVLCYRPERVFLSAFAFCLVFGIVLAAHPVEFYAVNRSIEEWMIYRFVVCGLVGAAGFQLLAGAAFTHRIASLGPRRRAPPSFWPEVAARFLESRTLLAFAAVALGVCLLLLWPGLVEYLTTGHVTMHWSRFMTAIFGLLLVAQSVIAGVLMRVLNLWRAQRNWKSGANQ